jgi:hypothetical protein
VVHSLVALAPDVLEQTSGWYHADEIDSNYQLMNGGTLTLKAGCPTRTLEPVLVADNTGCTEI